QQRGRAPTPPSELVDGCDSRLESLILRLLAKHPHDRPGYADDVGHELESIGAPAAAAEPPRAYLYRPRFSGREHLLGSLAAELLGASCHVLAEYAPALGELPGAERRPPPVRLPAERARDRVHRAVADALARFSRLRPMLMVVDDLQWADDLTVGALRALANHP